MNKSIKKVAAMALCCSMVFSLAACGAPAGTNSKAPGAASAGGDASILNDVGTYPIVKEPLTMTMAIMSKPYIEDYMTNDFTKYMEEKTGMHWEISGIAYEDSIEKINLLMAGDTYPDVFVCLNPDVVKYGVQEQSFIALDDLIPANMPNFVKNVGDRMNSIKQMDGKIYGIPALNESYHSFMLDKLWMNTMWQEKMGLKTPETIQELYDFCAAYLKLNPTGICFADYNKNLVEQWIMNSFILTPDPLVSTPNSSHNTIRTVMTPDKKVVSVATDEKYKEGLKWLKKFYDLGAIYEGNFAANEDALKSLVNQEGEPVLFFPRNYSGSFIDVNANKELYTHYRVIPPVAGPDGTRQSPYYKYDGLLENRFVITDKCKNPEAALRWIDSFFESPKASLAANYGATEGEDWIWQPEGKLGIDGAPAMYEVLKPYSTDVQNHDWQVTGPMYAPTSYILGVATPADVDVFTSGALEKYLYEETKNKMIPYQQKEGGYDVMPTLRLSAEQQDEISVPLVELQKHIDGSMVEFITGKKDVDKDWDAYVATFDALGMSKVLSIYQEAYDRVYK